MAEREAKRAEYLNKLDALKGELSSLNGEVDDTEEMIDDFDARLDDLPNRIQRIRRMNYKVLTYLEKDQASLVDRWRDQGPSLKENVRNRIAELRSAFNKLEGALSRHRRNPIHEVSRLRKIESRVGDSKSRVSELNTYVSDVLSEYENRLQNIEQDLKIAEATVDLTSQASFPWKEGESPILALLGKDVNNDVEGILTLTNQRFIFESEKEIVLKKMLFIATEKKKVREVVIDQPIGIIDSLTKGRIGFFAGHGLFITFKPQSRLKEMKFDTKGHEADWMLRFYNFIASGEAEKELAALQEDEGTEKGVLRPLVCEICGAPYTDEVYRGQTSVQCKYCGSVIPVTR